MQTVGVGKMRLGAAQLRSRLVHQTDEGGNISGHVFRDHVTGLVGGVDHQIIQQVPQGQPLARLEAHLASGLRNSGQRRLGNRDHFIQVLARILQGHHAGHDLGQAGRIDPALRVFGVDHDAGIELQQQGCLAARLVSRRSGEQIFPIAARIVRPGGGGLLRQLRAFGDGLGPCLCLGGGDREGKQPDKNADQ